jgi:transcriptional regulator with XRE-family HTH domain
MNRYELGKRMPAPELVERLAAELNLPAAYFYAVDDAEADLLQRYFRLTKEGKDKLNKYLAVLV